MQVQLFRRQITISDICSAMRLEQSVYIKNLNAEEIEVSETKIRRKIEMNARRMLKKAALRQ